MEALPAFQPGGLPKTLPYLARVSLYSTIALLQEAIIYRSYELETCHLLKIVAEGTPMQGVVTTVLGRGAETGPSVG